ncbi:hypothetical protein MAPG_08215 [Magnaporthiopsis poae ATCC 64411]|uniref:DNA repair protein Crb2 Tudor domain-containing protein n=1 Tax=Magnaporthiopsis poae (strain ATCC 64411 / 73-15) TaxID=644358 RepID=A0A0C4E6R9_MAGP6|nr:hypothetical protein MAPG_08215 [Magnaporthiopsis poae ATCC 64411]
MDLQKYEAEKADFLEQLEVIVQGLEDDPDNHELLVLKGEVEEALQLCNEQIAELQPAKPPTPPTPKAPALPALNPAPEQQKSRAGNAAASHKSGPAPPAPTDKEPEPEMLYHVNDNVMAKWLSGDKAFYPARITSVTGSSTAPIYTVKFKSYDTPTAYSTAAQKPIVSRSDNGIVLSVSATRYVQPQGGVGEGAEKTADAAAAETAKPVKKFKKIKATKELEKGKSNWQDFNNKSKFGKSQKKDSMFRTPEGIHGRVGFTGSGHPMRKDPTRTRHVYQPNEDLD